MTIEHNARELIMDKATLKRNIVLYVLWGLIIGMSLYTVYNTITTISDIVDKRSAEKKLKSKIEVLERKTTQDSLFIHQMEHSPEAAEKYIRETYHMQRQGETVYILE